MTRQAKARRVVWVVVGTVALYLGWQAWPTSAPVFATTGEAPRRYVSLRDRNGRLVEEVEVPADFGPSSPPAFSPAQRALYVTGDKGMLRWTHGAWQTVIPPEGPLASPGASLGDFALSSTGALAYCIELERPEGRKLWYLHRPGDKGLGRKLPYHEETELWSWSPGGDRLLGVHKGATAVFSLAGDGRLQVAATTPEQARRAGWAADGGVVYAGWGERTQALQRWSGRKGGKPVTIAERPADAIGPCVASPDGRLVAFATGVPSLFQLLKQPGSVEGTPCLEAIDLSTGRSVLRRRVVGPVCCIVWPTQQELSYQDDGQIRWFQRKMKSRSPTPILRVTLSPLRVRPVLHTTEGLLGQEGLPAVTVEGAAGR